MGESVFVALVKLNRGVSVADGMQGLRGLLATGMAVLAVVWVTSIFFTSKAYWRAVVAYARTGRMPDSEKAADDF